MTDRDAIETLKNYIESLMEDYGYYKDIVEFRDSVEHLEKTIKTQQEEIEHQIEKRNNQKEELAILNEKQKEFNKLTNTVRSYKGMFKKQQEEIEKKDKRISDLEFALMDMVLQFADENKDSISTMGLSALEIAFNELDFDNPMSIKGVHERYKKLAQKYYKYTK